jgi:hypothetical protein
MASIKDYQRCFFNINKAYQSFLTWVRSNRP